MDKEGERSSTETLIDLGVEIYEIDPSVRASINDAVRTYRDHQDNVREADMLLGRLRDREALERRVTDLEQEVGALKRRLDERA